MILIIGMITMVCMPLVSAIQTDSIYVGETGKIAGYCTYDYDANRYGDYIVWTRALDIYDNSGNVAPDNDVTDFRDPSWIMVQRISTGESWNLTEDYNAGLKVSPNQYYHSQSASINDGKILYEYVYGDEAWERTLFMYNITFNETWQIPHQSLSTYTSGYEHQIFGDWIYFTHYGTGRYIYIYNYETGEGRRIDGGATSNGNLGMDDEFVWFTDSTTTPRVMKMYGLATGRSITISGINIGASIYASNKASLDGKLGIYLDDGDADSYILDLVGENITDQGGDITIYWEDIASENIIEVDLEDSYDSYAPFTDGYNAVYSISDGSQQDILYYHISDGRQYYIASSNNDERLSDFSGTIILYHSNINSFTHDNDKSDDYDIYRTISDTENIGHTITNIIPIVIILIAVFFIAGALIYFGNSGSSGGML